MRVFADGRRTGETGQAAMRGDMNERGGNVNPGRIGERAVRILQRNHLCPVLAENPRRNAAEALPKPWITTRAPSIGTPMRRPASRAAM